MAGLKPLLQIQACDPIDLFGIITAPDCTWAEFMDDACRRQGTALANVRYDRALLCATLVPLYAPGDTLLSAGTLSTHTGETWKEITGRTTGAKMVAQTSAVLNTEWQYTYGTSPTVAIPDGGGLWIVLNRTAPRNDCTRDAAHVYVRVILMETSIHGFRIVWAYGEGPRVEETTDGSTWNRLADIPVGDISKSAAGLPDTLRFCIMRANGRLAFRATASNAVNESALVVKAVDLIYPLTVTGKNCNAAIGHFRVKFPDSGTITSHEEPIRYPNTNTRTPQCDGSASGLTPAMLSTGSDWSTQYQVTFASSSTNTITPYLRRVRVAIPATGIAPSANPVWWTLPFTEGFTLNQDFIPDQLTVRRGGEATFRNQEGQYKSAYGMLAVRVVAGLAWVDEYGVQRLLWAGVRMVGWLGLETSTDPRHFTASITDRIGYELDIPTGNHINCDGDCIYHAARMFFERGGFTRYWLADNMPGAPLDAWDCDGTSCNPAAGHIRLGQGTNEQPLWDFTEEMTLWQCLQAIAADYRMFCGVTSDGRGEFYPWDISNARNNWQPEQIFSTVPELDYSHAPRLNEFVGELVKRTSLAGVRNSVTIQGLREDTWEPNTSHQFDSAGIFGGSTLAGGRYRPPNFMGRLRPYIERNARYSDPAFADYACASKFNVFRQPLMWYDPLQCWPQPLFPLHQVGIAASKVMPGSDMFYIGGMSEGWATYTSEGEALHQYTMAIRPFLVPYGTSGSPYEQAPWGPPG